MDVLLLQLLRRCCEDVKKCGMIPNIKNLANPIGQNPNDFHELQVCNLFETGRGFEPHRSSWTDYSLEKTLSYRIAVLFKDGQAYFDALSA